MKYRGVTTDYADDGTAPIDHHDAVETFEDAGMLAEGGGVAGGNQHAVVSVNRYGGGEPDLPWSSRAE